MLSAEIAIPVVTPSEMAAIDEAAIAELSHEHPNPLEVLISRAGEAVAAKARKMLNERYGQCYGRRVLVLAGKGNNGKDGKEAARRLRSWGVQVLAIDIACRTAPPKSGPPKSFQPIDLIIDAAYGTGLSRPYSLPEFIRQQDRLQDIPVDIPVLAVDIPSGVCGLTGEVLGEAMPATATVTFGAHKPGLLFGEGKTLSGEAEVAAIGLDASGAKARVLTDASLAALLPKRGPDAHKWNAACWIVGGSPGMTGAPSLAARAAYRAGAGYVRLSTPAASAADLAEIAKPARTNLAAASTVLEAVGFALPAQCWGEAVLQASGKFHSLVVGPGLAASEETRKSVQQLAASDAVLSGRLAMVIDGGALEALGKSLLEARRYSEAANTQTRPLESLGKSLLEAPLVPSEQKQGEPSLRRQQEREEQKHEEQKQEEQPQVVLTPHDREYCYLFGAPPAADRIKAARDLAAATDAVVLLKGSTTVVAHPDGSVLLSTAGDQRLATAGTGDVLAGIIGALLAQGLNAFHAAAMGAELHGRAARLGAASGLIASDICDLLPQVLQKSSKPQMN